MAEYIKQNYGLSDEELKKAQHDYDRLNAVMWIYMAGFKVARFFVYCGCFVFVGLILGAMFQPPENEKVLLGIVVILTVTAVTSVLVCLLHQLSRWRTALIRKFNELEMLAGQVTVGFYQSNQESKEKTQKLEQTGKTQPAKRW